MRHILLSFPRSSVGMPAPALQRHVTGPLERTRRVTTLERGNQKNNEELMLRSEPLKLGETGL
ncbi:MAG: hypothetical protein WCI11_12750 [Candidatus Methylumidiphilus sp.]